MLWLLSELHVEKINLRDKLARIDQAWVPHVVGELNGQFVKVAHFDGEYVWHQHAAEDEAFLVLEGKVALHFRDGDVELGPGEMCIVPRGIEHKPEAVGGRAQVLLFEPSTTRNTGNVDDARTIEAKELPRI